MGFPGRSVGEKGEEMRSERKKRREIICKEKHERIVSVPKRVNRDALSKFKEKPYQLQYMEKMRGGAE